VPVAQAAGATVLTIEGLQGRHPLQRAFAESGGAQCGICTPGMIMAAAALGPRPTLEQVRTGLAGNICRCTGYEGIYRAIKKSEARRQKTEAPHQRHASGRTGAATRVPSPESRVPKSDRRGRA
jgi:aerobic-type carbon monoxide dehydrogenase small subunit (CoxS/CutS family)